MTTYTKLRTGDWGLRGTNLSEGKVVRVTKKSGDVAEEVVGKVLWRGPDGTCLATKGSSKGASSKPKSMNYGWPTKGRCRGCGQAVVNAPYHAAMDGYCGSCAFDEFDC